MLLVYPEYISDRVRILLNTLNIKSKPIRVRTFPNGEVLARIPNADSVRNQSILVYFPTYPDTNNKLQLLFQSLEVLNDYGANEINLVIPYLSYSRQDKRFLNGECISLKLLLKILYTLNVTRLFTANPHNADAVKSFSNDIEIVILDLFKDLLNKVIDIIRNQDVLLVAPDYGRCDEVRVLGDQFGLDHICLKKKRDRYTGKVEVYIEDESLVRHKSLLVIDDEISTGGTISKASELLTNVTSADIYACAIHLLLIGNAVDRMMASGVKAIFGTNTIDNPYSILEIEPYIAKAISNMINKH